MGIITFLRKVRQDRAAFKALIAVPVTGAVTMPANAQLAFRSVAGAVAGTTAGTMVGPTNRTIKTHALDAGAIMNHRTIYAERGTVVTPAAGFELLLHVGLGVFRKIGEGV